MSISYRDAGVDPINAGQILKDFGLYLEGRPKDPALLHGIGPFAACYSLKELLIRYQDPVLVTCCDGVGTKAMLALQWGVLKNLGQDLVAMNVNDLLCAGADPLLFLDYYACGKLERPQLTTLLHGIQAACEQAGCTLAGGETAEMPGLYQLHTFDLAGFSIGIGERSTLLGPKRVEVGDTLVALASSGAHSNGFSLIRKVLEQEGIRGEDRAPFSDKSWSTVLLQPTTLYVEALKGWNTRLHALAHVTGGGVFENLPRVLPLGTRARVEPWKFPSLFQWLQERADLPNQEMLSTFNCGVGMIAVCGPTDAPLLIDHLGRRGIHAWRAGEIQDAGASPSGPEVVWE